ncbi:PIR protein, putative [Plasmodium sp. gorilla clade G1]|nr:PIR protein, putative [Plasmodium sp. gorilla clade G1]
MRVHYINILMFALLLNILVYNQRNHKRITRHTPSENTIKTHRSLCECELFAQQNYDKDPEMKSVMKDFHRKTSQRLQEYDERMIKNKQKCKEQCEKDIQKIILKNKIENELKDKLGRLETNINTKDLPICECEKSLTIKVEKSCLRCGGVLGSGIAPSVGLLGTVVVNEWTKAAKSALIKFATKKGIAEGIKAGDIAGAAKVVEGLKTLGINDSGLGQLGSFIDPTNYTQASHISEVIYMKYRTTCTLHGSILGSGADKAMCDIIPNLGLTPEYATMHTSEQGLIRETVKKFVAEATKLAEAKKAEVTSATTTKIVTEKTVVIDATCSSYYTAIIASVVAILVIVFVMVIIYLILRYRRKKKMKKKLQYIKLLKA